MEYTLAAVIKLEDGKVGVLPFERRDEMFITNKLNNLGEVDTIVFPVRYLMELPKEIRMGELGELVEKETRNVKLDSDEYKLWVYNSDYDEIHKKIEELSPS